jgi:RNA polymerase II subunit A-like phosphatase
MVIIIDDRADVWNFSPNVIQVRPYRYFRHTGDINAPEGFRKNGMRAPVLQKKSCAENNTTSKSATGASDNNELAQNDDYLEHLEKVLQRLHTIFYQMCVV